MIVDRIFFSSSSCVFVVVVVAVVRWRMFERANEKMGMGECDSKLRLLF